MKLKELCEIPNVFDKKNVNTLNKKPKKLKKSVYGTGTQTVTDTGDSGGDGGDGGGE